MRHVVVIEDEPGIANLLARRFSEESFRVAIANDASWRISLIAGP